MNIRCAEVSIVVKILQKRIREFIFFKFQGKTLPITGLNSTSIDYQILTRYGICMLFKINFVLFVAALSWFGASSVPAFAKPMSCEGVLVIANPSIPETFVAFKPEMGSSQMILDGEVFEFHFRNGRIETLKIDRVYVPMMIEGIEHRVLLDRAVIDRLSHVVYWGQSQPIEEATDAKERALRRGFEIFVNDLRLAGGTLSLEQVQKKIGVLTSADVEAQVREGKLLAIEARDGSLRFPLMQFQIEGLRIRGLPEVLEALPTKNGAAILNFLLSPDPRLKNLRPIDLLRLSYVQPVVAAAHLYGEPGR